MGKLINVRNVEVGMTLDMEVIDAKSGAILVPEGLALTKPLIERLKTNKITSVIIREEEIPAGLKNEEFSEEYKNVSKKLDNVFDKVKEDGKIDAEDIVAEMDSFAMEITKESDILTQMRLLKAVDDYTFNHSMGVSVLALTLGKWLGYSDDQIVELSIAGLFHDIGKLRIPDEIINKPGKLTEEEFEIMKKHAFYSYEMLLKTRQFSNNILMGVLQHHEKIDGTGYPNGLKGKKIHDYAKIIAICDQYHALTSNRVYKGKDSPLRVADYIKVESFKSLDPHMVQVFLKNISKFYVGNKVLLSNGSTGMIVYIHPQDETKPIVQVGDQFIDFIKEKELEVIDILI